MLHATIEQEVRAVGDGLEGGRLPATWEVVDAEMYAIFRALRRVYREGMISSGRQAVAASRVLILTDCRSAMEQVESAWRMGHVRSGQSGDRRAMLEAICRLRARMGTCVLCYVPAHVGCSPNEYADACAKCHLRGEEVEDVAEKVAGWVESRPRVNEARAGNGEWALADRAMYKCAREQAAGYARGKVAEGVAEGRVTAGAHGALWEGPARRALEMAKPEAGEGGMVPKPTWEDVEAHNASVSMVMGLRSGDCVGVPHEMEWERRQRSEGEGGGPETRSGEWGCAACRREAVEKAKAAASRGETCGVPAVMPKATMRHWLTGRCAAASTEERRTVRDGMRSIVKTMKTVAGEEGQRCERCAGRRCKRQRGQQRARA